MRGSLTDRSCRLSSFGIQAPLSKLGPALYGATVPLPDFHYLATDAGSGVATITPLAAPGGTPTFTRATAAWTRSAAGDSWVTVASGSPRGYYTADGTFLGVLREVQRTASGLGIRDLTNAAWVAGGSPTVAKDGTGIDGVANSCSTITAGANNDTVLQTVTVAAANKVFQPFVKRITGTGTVEITIDGGTSWTDITSQINGSYHTQVQVSANIANPQYGFRLGTSGDKISVDMCELQTGLFATTPIGSAATRNLETLTFGAGSFTGTGGFTMWARGATNQNSTGATLLNVNDGSTTNRNVISVNSGTASSNFAITSGGVIQANLSPNGGAFAAEELVNMCGRTETNNFTAAVNGVPGGVDSAGSIPSGLTTVSTHLNATNQGGCLLEAKVWQFPLSNRVIRRVSV